LLVIPGRRVDTMPDQAVWAFARAHGQDRAGVVESVVLAVTNHRWTKVARPLLERLVADGLLDAGDAGRLGAYFLEADLVGVVAPGAWLAEFYLQQRGDDLGRLDPAKSYTLARRVSPQVRRWAAAQCCHDSAGVAGVLRRALAMDSSHGAAAVLGLVDAAERLDDADAVDLLELAADWPAPALRLAALKGLAARGRHGEALDRADDDRAATVRRWAARNRQRSLLSPGRAAGEPGIAATELEQPSLFG
jgi:hypothetical protein